MNRKHLKYNPDWVKEIPNLVPQTEKVKDAAGKEVDKIITTRLLTEHQEVDKKIKKLEADISKTSNLKSALRYLQSRINLWSDTATSATYQNYSNNFHSTRDYNWEGKLKNWYSTGSGTYKDNLYKLTINGNEYEITEEELLNLMARCVKAFEKVDASDFTTKYTAGGGTGTNLSTWLTNLQTEAPLIKVGTGKDKDGTTSGGRKSYDFPETYPQKHDNHAKYSGTPVYDNFFELIKEVKAHEGFLTNLDADLQKDVPQSEKYQIFLKGDKWDSTKLKEDFGIEIASGQNFYKTGSQKVEFEVKNGLKGWIDLANTIVNADNQNKIVYLHETNRNNRPNLNLFNDILDSVNASTADFEGLGGTQNTFQKGATVMGLDKLPASQSAYQETYDKLEALYDADKVRLAGWLNEVDEKKKEQKKLEGEVDKLITERIAELRTQLVQFKIEEGFEITYKADGTTVDKDNRRSRIDIQQIKSLLEDIRYLESADDTLLSSVGDENTAYDKVAEISDKVHSTLIYYLIVIDGTNQEKIAKIKKDPLQGTGYLQRCLDEFNRVEKLIKLSEVETQLKKDIQTAMGQKDDTETLKSYTDVLKTFDTSLETGFTEALKTKWQGDEAKNFQNTTSLKNLLESVKKNDKYDDFFNHIKGGVNGYENVKDQDTWGKLMLKEPKVVITAVERYKYDNLEDTGEDKEKKKTQMTRKILKAYSKPANHTLTDEELNTAVYEVAIGSKTLSTKSLKADLTEYETNTPSQNPTEKGHFAENWGWYALGGGILGVGGIVAVFWNQIKAWWEPKEEGESEKDSGDK